MNNLTTGKVTPTIFRFCIPLIFGTLLQILFNITDQIVLGQMAGTLAVAAVGACGSAVHLVINFFAGMGAAVTILLSRSMGENDREKSADIISTSVFSSLLLGLIGLGVGLACARPLLLLTKCPEECFRDALLYLTIYYLATPVIVIYNFGASALRAMGDSRRPTVYLTIGGVLNVILNIVLCLILSRKVAAVAIATLTSQAVAAFLTVRRLCRLEEKDLRFRPAKRIWKAGLFGKILRYGLPIALVDSVYPIANLQIQTNVNSFGPLAMAGFTAAAGINSIISCIPTGFSHTANATIGQNLGAGNRRRVYQFFWLGLLYMTALTVLASGLVYFFHEPLISLYSRDAAAEVIFYGADYIKAATIFYFICAVNAMFGKVLGTFGYAAFAAGSSILSIVVFRPIWIATAYGHFKTFFVLMLCFPVSWTVLLLLQIVLLLIVFGRYRHGKLKKL